MRDTVFSGAFALALLFGTAWHVGSKPAMLLCAASALAAWLANLADELQLTNLWFVGALFSAATGATALIGLTSKIFGGVLG